MFCTALMDTHVAGKSDVQPGADGMAVWILAGALVKIQIS